MVEVTEADKLATKQHQQRFLTEGRSETELLWEAFATLSARVETLEAGMSQYLKDGQTPLERMEQDQADILGLMKLLQKEKELTEKLRWALSDAVTTNTESCRERDAALHRIDAAKADATGTCRRLDSKSALSLRNRKSND